MPWQPGPTNPKYRTPEHRRRRAALVAQLKQQGHLTCTADVCVMPTRTITNPNGNARDGLHLGHTPDGTSYAGPQHNACNIRDGAVRARSRQTGSSSTPRWIL